MIAPGEQRTQGSLLACEHLRWRLMARGRSDLAATLQRVQEELAEQILREQIEAEQERDDDSAA